MLCWSNYFHILSTPYSQLNTNLTESSEQISQDIASATTTLNQADNALSNRITTNTNNISNLLNIKTYTKTFASISASQNGASGYPYYCTIPISWTDAEIKAWNASKLFWTVSNVWNDSRTANNIYMTNTVGSTSGTYLPTGISVQSSGYQTCRITILYVIFP